MTASARYSMPRAQARNGRSDRSTRSTSTSTIRVPNRSACSRNLRHQLRAEDPVGEARVVLDVARDHQLAAGHDAGEDDRLEIGARGVDRRGQAGRARADDQDLGPVLVAIGAVVGPPTGPPARSRAGGEDQPGVERIGAPSGASRRTERDRCAEATRRPTDRPARPFDGAPPIAVRRRSRSRARRTGRAWRSSRPASAGVRAELVGGWRRPVIVRHPLILARTPYPQGVSRASAAPAASLTRAAPAEDRDRRHRDRAPPTHRETPLTDGLALATRGLQKRYGSRTALAGLDLSVPSGVVYGFLGPNGAGKTTTMRLLTGLIHPDAGTIEVLGRPFGRRDRHRLFEVGALIESPSFYPYLSARENLRSLAAAGAPTSRSADRGAARAGRAARSGQRQGPDLLARHEAAARDRRGAAQRPDACSSSTSRRTASTRPGSSRCARRSSSWPRSGKTVFVSSHILGEVQQLADVLGIIAAGRLVREGPIEQLLAGEGLIRVRVAPAEVAAARAVLDALVPGTASIGRRTTTAGCRCRSRRIGRPRSTGRSPTAGIYASGLETGNDLESLFLELTGGDDAASHEGTFFGAAGSAAPPPSGTGAGCRAADAHEALRRRPAQARPPAGDVRHVRAARRPARPDLHRRRGDRPAAATRRTAGGRRSCSSRSRAPTRSCCRSSSGSAGCSR